MPEPTPIFPRPGWRSRLAEGYRLGSTMEFSGYDDSIHPKRLNLRNGVEEYLTEPYGEPVNYRLVRLASHDL